MCKYVQIDITEDSLFNAVEFVVNANFSIHKQHVDMSEKERIIDSIYQFERQNLKNSRFYGLIWENRLIASIRILYDDKEQHVNPVIKNLFRNDIHRFLHIGCFAIHASVDSFEISRIFKHMILIAFNLICEDSRNVLVAECDIKLLNTLKLMGVNIKDIGVQRVHMGSQTSEVYATFNDIYPFCLENQNPLPLIGNYRASKIII